VNCADRRLQRALAKGTQILDNMGRGQSISEARRGSHAPSTVAFQTNSSPRDQSYVSHRNGRGSIEVTILRGPDFMTFFLNPF